MMRGNSATVTDERQRILNLIDNGTETVHFFGGLREIGRFRITRPAGNLLAIADDVERGEYTLEGARRFLRNALGVAEVTAGE
jgi:hypothetical protein